MKHYVTRRKVAGSILVAVVGHDPSGCAVALGSTQPLNRVPVIFSGGKGGRYVGLTTLPLSVAYFLVIW